MRQTVAEKLDPLSPLSQSLIEATFAGDEDVLNCILSDENEDLDVNFMGTYDLWIRHTHTVQCAEGPDELKIEYKQFKTDVTPLFVAAHAGHVNILKKLLAAGADVNQNLFRGYATTAAAREGHCDALAILLKSGACQPACEEALLEACLFGEVKAAELLISCDMARPEVLANAIVHASNRGLLPIVTTLIKGGADLNSWHRILLRSAKPALYASVDSTPLFAAIVGRQADVVKCLLDAGARTDCKAKLGAWSWDSKTPEVLRVGAGMAEPYNEAWCAVEYWDGDGSILALLLDPLSPDTQHHGRTLLCHAVLCRNAEATQKLLEAGANVEHCICTKDGHEFRPLHLSARMGSLPILKILLSYSRCDLNAKTESGETALMLSALYGHPECFFQLLSAGADLGVANRAGENVLSLVTESSFVHDIIWDALLDGRRICSTDFRLFSPLRFVARRGNTKLLQQLLQGKVEEELDAQDELGFSAAMIASEDGHMECLRALVFAGANVGLKNRKGDTLLSLAPKREACERLLVEAILADELKGEDFKALHFAAKRGDTQVLTHLLRCNGNEAAVMNSLDEEGCTPLMVSAREGHAEACKVLLKAGVDCYVLNSKGETALAMARKHKVAEGVILDHIAREFVVVGGQILKHTREGKGNPHMKQVEMSKGGVVSWGETSRRNVVCREVMLGCSPKFKKNRKKAGDAENPGLFRVVSVCGREVHFEASNACHAQLWVRGVNLILKENDAGLGYINGGDLQE